MSVPTGVVSETKEFFIELAIVIALVLVACVLGTLSGYENGKAAAQKAAIEAGVAKWSVDPRTGATRFEFTTPATQ